MNAEACATNMNMNMTGWLSSRDGDFCDAFLRSCLTRREYAQYERSLRSELEWASSLISSSNDGSDADADAEYYHVQQQQRVVEMQTLILSELLSLGEDGYDENDEDEGEGEEGFMFEHEMRKVLIKIILSWAGGCDGVILESYDEGIDGEVIEQNHMAMEFLWQYKSKIDNRPMLSVSLASASASGSKSNSKSDSPMISIATMDQARAFLVGNHKNRDAAWCDTHVAVIECSCSVLMGMEQYCFQNSVVGSMIDFTSGSGLHVKEGVLAIPFVLSHNSDNDEDDDDDRSMYSRNENCDYDDDDEEEDGDGDGDGGDDHEDYMSAVSRYTRQDLQNDEDLKSGSRQIALGSNRAAENVPLFQRNESSRRKEHRCARGYGRRVVTTCIRLTLFLVSACILIYSYRYLSFLHHNDPYFHFPWHPSDQRKEFDLKTIAELSANKTIVITGASAGLGMSSAKLLAKAGTARLVVMGCRNMEKCEKAKRDVIRATFEHVQVEGKTESEGGGGGVGEHDDDMYTGPKLVPMHLDISSRSSIEQFANDLQDILWEYETFSDIRSSPKLDILMDNAGVMCPTDTIQYHNETNVEMQMHVNHLGHFALSHLLLKNLERGGRIVSVSSLAGTFPFHFSNAASKSGGRGEKGLQNTLTKDVGNDKCTGITIDDHHHCAMDDSKIQGTGDWIISMFFKYIQNLHVYKTIESVSSYGASKRANLLFTHGFNQRYSGQDKNITAVVSHPGYSRTSLMITGWSFAPTFVRTFFQRNVLGSMSSDDGAMSQIRAALDIDNVKVDMYVGPLFLTVGKPVIIGSSLRSFHHLFWPIVGKKSKQNGDIDDTIVDEFWKFSEESLGYVRSYASR